jgi:hypothetical protein
VKYHCLTAALLLVASPVQAQVQECFAGIGCHEAAEASISFGIVRDCPANFEIRSDKKARFAEVMQAVLHSPSAKGNGDFSSKPKPVAKGLCDGVARKVLSGASKIEFLAVKQEAAQRLTEGGK